MNNETKKQNELRGHVFDGIQEYDNDLPRWWVRLFYVTVFFGVPYFLWYHLPFFPSKSLVDEYRSQTKQEEKVAEKPVADSFNYSDPAAIEKGKATFAANCVPCHGPAAGGVIGPNLTDDFWLYGNKISDVEHTISIGATAKGMPAWGSMLGAEKIRQLAAYIKSIQGSNPANAKASQGAPGKFE